MKTTPANPITDGPPITVRKPEAEPGCAPAAGSAAWRDLKTNIPPLRDFQKLDKPYVLAVDAKGRMTIAYAYKHSTGEIGWTTAKPVGAITHWMPLPEPPNSSIEPKK